MIAFDTNILLYSCDKSDQRRHATARQLIRSTPDAVLLWQVAVEFIAATRRLEQRGFTRPIAWVRLKNFVRIWRLIVPSEDTLGLAEELHVAHGWSYWDALIVVACLDAGVKRLYSEDLPGRVPPEGVEIVNPFA